MRLTEIIVGHKIEAEWRNLLPHAQVGTLQHQNVRLLLPYGELLAPPSTHWHATNTQQELIQKIDHKKILHGEF